MYHAENTAVAKWLAAFGKFHVPLIMRFHLNSRNGHHYLINLSHAMATSTGYEVTTSRLERSYRGSGLKCVRNALLEAQARVMLSDGLGRRADGSVFMTARLLWSLIYRESLPYLYGGEEA